MTLAMSTILSYTLLTSILIHHIDSQCSNLDSNTCPNDGYCLFNSNSHCICGQTTWNQDIAFIFDSSMSSLEWTYTKQFAADLLYYGSPSISTTRAAIFETADGSNPSTNTLSFGAEPISITINTTLPNLVQTFEPDFYLEIALQAALDLFTSSSSSSRRKIVIIFASQEFKQSPCKINMRANEIYTYTIAIGNGWNKYPLICVGSSENNYEGLRSVTDASQLQSILTNMEAITCPHHPLIKLTEIQLAGVNGEEYIELYNYGHTISDMSQFSISGIGSKALPSSSLSTGTLAVVYNTDQSAVNQADIPNCANCGCTEDADTTGIGNVKWCDSAEYIGCCNSCDPNNYVFERVSDCEFNTGLSMTSFTIELKWKNPSNDQQITVESVTFDANQYWPTVATNYALELKNKGYNNKFGSSWTMSCDADGTPGDDHGSATCSYDCQSDGNVTCDLSGGMLLDSTDLVPGCVVSTKTCNCLAGYYAYYQTCLPLPPPSNCISKIITGSVSQASFIVARWDGDTTYTYLHCERIFGCTGDYPNNLYAETSTSFINPVIYDPGRDKNETHFVLNTIGSGGEKWYSKRTNCTSVTGAPTTDPTPSPTYSVPLVPECNISLSQDMKSFDIYWQPINMQQFGDTAAPNDTFLGYIYYYNGVLRSTATECCTDSGTPPGGNTYDLLNDEVSVSGDWDSTFTDVSTLDELSSATNCSVAILEPTPTPTSDPTIDPTSDPTRDPSKSPTKNPTLQELYVPFCSGTVLQGTKTFDMNWTAATFNNWTAPISDTKYAIEWFYIDGGKGGESVSANQGPRRIQVDDYLNVTLLQMYCSWSGGYERGRSTNCTINTLSPTPSPTNNPTDNPTKAPTDNPTKAPTDNPTKAPTNNPSYNPTKTQTDTSTNAPTANPISSASTTNIPTNNPTNNPTNIPTNIPTNMPTNVPTKNPTSNPTSSPTANPLPPGSPTKATLNPSTPPADNPVTVEPTRSPTYNPTNMPTSSTTYNPTNTPTSSPTDNPTKCEDDQSLENNRCPDDGCKEGAFLDSTLSFSVCRKQSFVGNRYGLWNGIADCLCDLGQKGTNYDYSNSIDRRRLKRGNNDCDLNVIKYDMTSLNVPISTDCNINGYRFEFGIIGCGECTDLTQMLQRINGMTKDQRIDAIKECSKWAAKQEDKIGFEEVENVEFKVTIKDDDKKCDFTANVEGKYYEVLVVMVMITVFSVIFIA